MKPPPLPAHLIFHIITLFPEQFPAYMEGSILGRAYRQNLFQYHLVPLRDFGIGRHKKVDDTPYGGGGGMLLMVEPLVRAIESVQARLSEGKARVLAFTPGGERLSQSMIETFKTSDAPHHLILVCGHYEGFDQRFLDYWVDEEISIGEFVLTGGELPAMVFMDAVVRQIPGTLGNPQGPLEESFAIKDAQGNVMLEHPQYTRPETFRSQRVPEVLLSGHHQHIERWKKEQTQKKTFQRQTKRPS